MNYYLVFLLQKSDSEVSHCYKLYINIIYKHTGGRYESVMSNPISTKMEYRNIEALIIICKYDRGRKQSGNNLLTLNNKSIGYVKFTKFLGVIIDEQLNWLNHISYVKNKISKGFGIILRARKFFTKKTLSNLYNAFILPYLLYCVEIWGNAAECPILPIITLQKKIIRFITFSPYLAHTKNLFLDANILPFKKLVIHRIGIQMFKFNLGLSPVALNNLFVRNSNIHNYNTRNKNKLRSAIGRHKFIYKNFRYISVHIWNNITDKIDTDTSLLTFKKQLKVLLFTDEITIPLES